MRENKFRKWIRTEIETEAEALEKKAEENTELSSLHMPEDSFADLMNRIESEKKSSSETPASSKPFHIRRRTLVAVALAAVLLAALGLGASGERLFAPTVESEIADGEYNVRVINGEDVQYFELTEEEAYEEIEESLGILALRLGYKPQELKLENVYIDKNMGEAQMEFCYDENVLIIYESKQNDSASFDTKFDGEVIDSIETFHYNKGVNILEIDKGERETYYAIQLEEVNAYYNITSNLKIEEFKDIIQSVFFKNM